MPSDGHNALLIKTIFSYNRVAQVRLREWFVKKPSSPMQAVNFLTVALKVLWPTGLALYQQLGCGLRNGCISN